MVMSSSITMVQVGINIYIFNRSCKSSLRIWHCPFFDQKKGKKVIKSKETKGSQSKALLPIHIFHHFINCTRHLLLTMSIAKLLLHSLSFYFSYLTLNEIRHSRRAAKSFRNTLENAFFSLEWLACNGCNFFVSTLNCAPFEGLDCWLPELLNGI